MEYYLRIINQINKYFFAILGILLGFMFIVIFLQIIARYIFSSSLVWSEEMARYLMIYSVFIGASLALRRGRMIAVEFLVQKLSIRKKDTAKIIIYLITLFFLIILFIKGVEITMHVHTQSTSSLGIPMSIPYFSISVGTILMLINVVALIFEVLIKKRDEVK